MAQGAEHEPNNTPSTAAAISLDETLSAEIRPPTDEIDFYSFPVEPKTKYTLTLSAANCKGSSSLPVLAAELLNAKTNFPVGKEVTFGFTTGSPPQDLLRIEGESCGYEFRVSKD